MHALFFNLSLKFQNLSLNTSECQVMKRKNKLLYVLNERMVFNLFSISTIISFFLKKNIKEDITIT